MIVNVYEVLAMVPNADHPTLTLTRTPWGDQLLDAVACEGYRLIRPARMLCLEELFERSEFLIATSKKKKTDCLCVWMFV